MKNNIILNSLKESFSLIKKHKKLIFLLFILQIISLLSLLAVNGNYQSKMLESTRSILEYIEEQNFGQNSLDLLQQKNVLGPDPLLISRNFKNILFNLKFLVFYSLLIFILLNGFMWYITGNLINNKIPLFKNLIKKFPAFLFRFGIVTLIFSSLIFLFTSSVLRYSINPLAEAETNFLPYLIGTIVLIYFIYITYPSLHKTELKNLLKRLFNVGIKKAHIVIITYFLIFLIISVLSVSLLYLLERNIFLMALSLTLIVFAFVWSRLFLVLVVDKLN